MKNPFKKKEKFPTANVPRSQAELNQAYTSLCARAGDMQYKVYALQTDIATINKQLLDLQKEGAERERLDKKAAADAVKAAPKEEGGANA